MVFEAISAGVGLLGEAGGFFGNKSDAKRALEEQRRLIAETRGLYGDARGALDDAEYRSLADVDAANEILAGVEPAVLNALDEQQRVMIGRQIMDNRIRQSQMEARLASSGLDATTAGAGMQRSLRFGEAQQIGQLGASMAGQRANAIAGARGNLAQGMMNRGQMQASFGSQRAGVYQNEAGFVGGIQVQPGNSAEGIGNLAGALSNAFAAFGGSDGPSFDQMYTARRGLNDGIQSAAAGAKDFGMSAFNLARRAMGFM